MLPMDFPEVPDFGTQNVDPLAPRSRTGIQEETLSRYLDREKTLYFAGSTEFLHRDHFSSLTFKSPCRTPATNVSVILLSNPLVVQRSCRASVGRYGASEC